jgi:hypothetical protein
LLFFLFALIPIGGCALFGVFACGGMPDFGVGAAIGGITGAVLLVVFSLVYQPLEHLALADEMEVLPGLRRYPAKDIREVSFGPDPAEDYVEQHLPIRLCEAAIQPKVGRPIRLIVSAGDAARLRGWADGKGIAVRDPEGYAACGPSE